MNNIKKDINLLQQHLKRITNMGWIYSPTKDNSSGGLLFEQLIGKERDRSDLPDFGNIEIKTKYSLTREFITLFHANPDRSPCEIERIINLYGYPDRKDKRFKVFHLGFDSAHFTRVSYHYYFHLAVDQQKQEIILQSRNTIDYQIETVTSWSFDLLKEKLLRKLQYLLLVNAKRKTIRNQLYYKYDDYQFYHLLGFEQFIKLIELGKVQINFQVGVFRTGPRTGQIHNHGIGFLLKEEDLPLLFEKIAVS